MSITWPVSVAIYEVLRGDLILAGLSLSDQTPVVRVYNDVTEGAGYPHVLISRTTETPKHTFGGRTSGLGWKNVIRIHVYSRYQGDKEAELIKARIVELLNYQPLTVPGFPETSVEYQQGLTMVEKVEKLETRHSVGEVEVEAHQ